MTTSTTTSIQWGAVSEAGYTGVTGSEDAAFVPSGGTLKPQNSVKVAVTISNGNGDCLNNGSVFFFENVTFADANNLAVATSTCDG